MNGPKSEENIYPNEEEKMKYLYWFRYRQTLNKIFNHFFIDCVIDFKSSNTHNLAKQFFSLVGKIRVVEISLKKNIICPETIF